MKTAREHREQIEACDYASDEIAVITARDAEHRAEILKLQDDLLQGANREVALEATIERLGKDAATMAEKLDRAVTVLRECVAMMRIQEKRSSGEFHLSAEAFVPMWSSSLDAADKFLTAPPPAESTPVQCQRESCDGGIKCRCGIGRTPAPPDDIPSIWLTPLELSKRLDDIRERLERLEEWASMREHGPLRLAAMEAKGEPGTTFCDEHGREDCGRPDHTKGAKP